MRRFGKILTVFSLVFALIYGLDWVLAQNVYIQRGEIASRDAWLELDESQELSLGMMDCRKTTKKLNFTIGLFVSDHIPVSNELKNLQNHELNDQMDLVLCINRICEERTWQFLASGFGEAFFTKISIDQKRGPIYTIRVIIPNEGRKYEYLGDVDDILKRICRR